MSCPNCSEGLPQRHGAMQSRRVAVTVTTLRCLTMATPASGFGFRIVSKRVASAWVPVSVPVHAKQRGCSPSPTPPHLELLAQHLGEEIKLLSNDMVVLGPEVKKAGACKVSQPHRGRHKQRALWSGVTTHLRVDCS